MGPVETGVWESLAREGIEKPSTALEFMAIEAAKRLDNGVNDQSLSGVMRELRLTLEKIHDQPRPVRDAVSDLIDRQ